MAFENLAAIGRDVAVLLSLGGDTEVPEDGAFTALGAVRGLDYGAEWDTEDTTARGTSAGFSRSSLVTYKNNNLSIDGLVIVNDEFQQSVEDHIENPPAEDNHQPYAWVRIVEPRAGGASRIKTYPVVLSSFQKSAPFDSAFTYSMECAGQGDPVVQDVPANGD